MGKDTAIEWCDHTFNPWIGCTKVSAACDHCYAETLAKRYGWAKWGAGEPRKRTSVAYWRQPVRWNERAFAEGVRRRVFCASLADVFDAEVPEAWRHELMNLINITESLDWLLLTKRPQVAKKFFADREVPDNVWLGTTVEDQAMANLRIPTLLEIPAAKHFLSCEPMLGPISLDQDWYVWHSRINWIICGGESGRGARPMHPSWVRDLRRQCLLPGIAFFFKQWGDWLPGENYMLQRPCEPAQWQDGETGQHSTCKNKPEERTPEWRHFTQPGQPGAFALRVGKKKAGALLDGRMHREFPS